MAANDATPLPIKNQALRITFGLWLTTGLINSGASGLDSEVSIDGGTYTDCTNEATEIASSSGTYYLDLTSGEMNGDTIAIQVKSSTTNAITYKITIYPATSTGSKFPVNAGQIGGQTASASGTVTFPNATLASTTNITSAAGIAVSSIGSNVITATSIASDAITSAKIADGAIDSATFASGALDAVWSTAARTLTAGTNIQLPSNGLANVTAWTVNLTGSLSGAVGSVTGNVGGNVTGSVGSISGVSFPSNFSTLSIDGSGLVNITQAAADKAWGTATRVLTAGTNIVLPSNALGSITAWTVAITGDITGNLSGSVGSVTGLTASNLDATISSRAAAATALSTAVWTGTLATNLATTNASVVQIKAAVYDSATLSGSTLTLSNAATMTVTTSGRVTA